MFQSVSAWLERIRRQHLKYANPTAQIGLGPVLGHACPMCRQGLNGHDFAEIATTVAAQGRESRLEEFITAARDQNWSVLKSFHEFEGDKNALGAYVIRCTEGKRVYVILVCNPVELYDPYELLDVISDVRDATSLTALVPEKAWQPFF